MKNDNNKSKIFQNRFRIVNGNEKKEDMLFEMNESAGEEKIMNDPGKGRALNYDLMLSIEEKKDNYSGVIRVLEDAIKNSGNGEKYRKMRKMIIMKKILSDMNIVEDNGSTASSG